MDLTCYLALPQQADGAAFDAMMRNWRACGGRLHPGLLRAYQGDYPDWLRGVNDWSKGVGVGEAVPQTLFFLKSGAGDILGAASIRHYLNHTNLIDGGHLAYGIAPAHRGKGYGTRILALALQKMKEMGIRRVLITCDASNIPSQKVIRSGGGRLEHETLDEDGVPIHRYWIDN